MRVRVVLTAIAVSLGWACASGGGSARGGGATASGSAGPSTQRISTSRDVIAEAEITSRASDASTAYQIVEKLRPQMLRARGSSISMNPDSAASTPIVPRVYVDGISFGEVNTLSNIAANQVKEIRFISARDATTQWGTGHMGGVILVTTKK
jgi:hypothetical protein